MKFYTTSSTLRVTRLLLGVSFVHLMASGGCSEINESGKPSAKPKSIVTKENSQDSDLLITDAEFRPWKFIVLHHTATDSGSLKSIDKAHKQRRDGAGNPWKGIGYHFLIGNGTGMEDGEIASTFRWHKQISGAHAGSRQFNDYGIGICLVGNFENQKPTKQQVKSTAKLVSLLTAEFGMSNEQVLKHGDLKATACPGRQFPFDQIISSVSQGTEIAQQHTGTNRELFQPLRPGSKEVIRNVAAISRSKSNARSNSESSNAE